MYGKKKEHFWQDDYGLMKDQYLVATFVGGIIAFVAFIVMVGCVAQLVIETRSCADRGDAYNLPTKYSFWANTCWAETANGNVNVEGLEQNAKGQIIYLEGDGSGQKQVVIPR